VQDSCRRIRQRVNGFSRLPDIDPDDITPPGSPDIADKIVNLRRLTKSHNVVSSTPRHEQHSNSYALVVIGTDCTGSCKSNYHTITPTCLKRHL
jgi:hypothetical protein